MIRVAFSLVLAAGLTGSGGTASAGPPTFSDRTADSGIRFKNLCGAPGADKRWALETFGAGAAWLDYDGDGKLDLYLVNGSNFKRGRGKGEPNRLYRGDGKGRFTDVTAKTGVGDPGWGYGVGVGDFDNDGRPDLYVTNYGANVLYRNKGDGTFENVTARAGVAGHEDLWSTAAAFFDIEGDGDLDLYVGNYMDGDPERVPGRGDEDADCYYRGMVVYCGPLGQVPQPDVLYRNNGDGSFTDVTKKAGLFLELPRYTLGAVTADLDNDGDQDLYVANDFGENAFYRNDGERFSEIAAELGIVDPGFGMGVSFGDYDADGDLDLHVTNMSSTAGNRILRRLYPDEGGERESLGKLAAGNSLYQNQGDGTFRNVTAQSGGFAAGWAFGGGFLDFDNDGREDLYTPNGFISGKSMKDT
jgi:hypothetical protein